MTKVKVMEWIGNNDDLRDKWLRTDKDTWAEVGGLSITGEMRERDAGVSFGTLIANLDEPELLQLRYQLADEFSPKDDPEDRTPLERVARHLVEVVEAELGGRWVS